MSGGRYTQSDSAGGRRQSIGPKPDSRPRLEGARYKYLTSCSCLLSHPSPFSHAHIRTHHYPDSSPPGLTQWTCYKKASAYGSRVGWTPARRIRIYPYRCTVGGEIWHGGWDLRSPPCQISPHPCNVLPLRDEKLKIGL